MPTPGHDESIRAERPQSEQAFLAPGALMSRHLVSKGLVPHSLTHPDGRMEMWWEPPADVKRPLPVANLVSNVLILLILVTFFLVLIHGWPV